jgi:maleylacetoacetate isomerase
MSSALTLYDYPLSSASYRVRIALNLKGLAYERVTINLRDGAHRGGDYLAHNPAGLVPALGLPDGTVIGQSLAIMRYLDTVAEPRLFPADPLADARVSAMAMDIACDIHPLNNLRVLNYISGTFGQSDQQKNAWYAHWVEQGFAGLEQSVRAIGGAYCAGDAISAADLCLVPQMFNARRFKVDLSAYPTLVAIDARLCALPAVIAATPALPS